MSNRVQNTSLDSDQRSVFINFLFCFSGPEHIYAEIYPQNEKEEGKQVCFVIISLIDKQGPKDHCM